MLIISLPEGSEEMMRRNRVISLLNLFEKKKKPQKRCSKKMIERKITAIEAYIDSQKQSAKEQEYTFTKKHKKDKVWRAHPKVKKMGPMLFSFDKKTVFNVFSDYPQELTKEEKEIFDKEYPFWADWRK